MSDPGEPGRGLRFGEAADLYDRHRPSYPPEAVSHVLAVDPAPADMVEVGCGTGKATAAFAARGLRITGIEPDAEMAALARRNVPSATIVVSRFEDWDGPERSADLVVSAQAWHWTDRSVAIPKAAGVLRGGGRIALMSNRPRDGGVDLRGPIEAAHEAVVPGLVARCGMLNWTGQFDEFFGELRHSGLFKVDSLWHLSWEQPLDADAYIALTCTHADYIVLDDATRHELCAALRRAIDDNGGVATLLYRTMVLTASRLSR